MKVSEKVQVMNINEAKKILDDGGLVAIPTETVYGLAANALNPKAVTEIFKIKKRPLYNPLIVHISDLGDVFQLAKSIPKDVFLLGQKFWPGPLTMVLEKTDNVPSITTGGEKTVAIRIPNHPLTLSLLEELDYPLAAPSANKYKGISPTHPKHVYQSFGNGFPVLNGGACSLGIESTIIGFENNKIIIYRHGLITAEEIAAVVKKEVVEYDSEVIIMPGQERKHYSPNTPLIYTEKPNKVFLDYIQMKIAFIKFSDLDIDSYLVDHTVQLTKNNGMQEAAEKLYETLHELDAMNFDLIVAEKVPEIGIGKAIHDKLNRANNF